MGNEFGANIVSYFNLTNICKVAYTLHGSRCLKRSLFENVPALLTFYLSFAFKSVNSSLTTLNQSCSNMPGEVKPVLRYAKLTEKAFPPQKGSERSAGYDLKSAYDYVVKAGDKALVQTDLQIELPRGSYGRIAPRSGLALKNHIDVGAGVVDEDYRGSIGVVLFNHADEAFVIKRGDRIAQLICEKIFYPELQEADSLDDTERGRGGFGSTGVRDS